jgi:O-methyltransferase
MQTFSKYSSWIFDRIRFARNIGYRFAALWIIAEVLCPEFRMRYNNINWMTDESFNRYLRFVEKPESINSGRRWMVYQLLRLTKNTPGDTAECGAYRGASSYLICSFIEHATLPKIHHVFDSFEGLSQPVGLDGAHWRKNDLRADATDAKKTLERFRKVEFYKGWIPDRFPEVADRHFSFVHIDVDIYEPTRDSMAFFYPRLSDGGIILCDDYGFKSCPGATKAVDDFLRDKPEKMVALSDGGGFMIKGVHTSPPYSLD